MPRTRHPRQGTGQPSGQRTDVQRTDGESYHRALIAEQELADREDVERASDDEDNFENDGSVLLQIAHTDPSDGSISDHSSQRPRRDRTSNTSLPIDENEVSQDSPRSEIAISGGGDGSADAAAHTPPQVDGNTSTVDVDG